MTDITPTRPLVRYHGGKWKLAPWILSYFPRHRVYVEPFGGGGSILLRKPRSYAEVYNDLDSEMVNLFRVARDHGERLRVALELTPFAREEFVGSYEPAIDVIEQARRTVIRSFMGFGSASVSGRASGFRANSSRSGTTPAHDWANYPTAMVALIERLQGVVIENRPALDVAAQHDSADTLHYFDPPYVHSTRHDAKKGYRFEMTDEDHIELAEALLDLEGAVIVSGYPCELYEQLYTGWTRVENKGAHADCAQARTEVLWMRNVNLDQLF